MNLDRFLSAATADPLNQWMFDVTIRTTLLLVILAGAVIVLRRLSAAGRHFLWGLGLTSSLLLPFVIAITPAIHWKIIPAADPPFIDRPSAKQTPEDAASSLGPRTADAGTPGIRLQQTPEASPRSVTHNPALHVPPAGPAKTHSAFVLSPELPWILWAIGAVFTGAYFAAGWVGILRLRRKLQPVHDEELSRQAHQIAASAGLPAPPRLMQFREARVPFTLGYRSAVIVLPGEWKAWTQQRRRFVLMHETAHIRRNDWLTQWLGWLAATVYWFNPIVWFIVKQLRIEAEKACDDAVLLAGHVPSHYAEELLAIAASLPSGRILVSPAIPMAQRAKFEERIQAILNTGVNRSPFSKLLVVGTILGVGLLLPLLAAVEVASKDETAAAAPSPSQATETTSSSAPLKDSIRSVSGKVSIEILVSGSDRAVHGLLSPDGKKIAFEGWGWRNKNDKNNKDDVIVRDLVSGNEVPLTQKAYDKPDVYEFANFNFENEGGGCWSPDSQWVAYVWFNHLFNETGASWELRIGKADGSENKVLKTSDWWVPYAWSPDGLHLLCELEPNGKPKSNAVLNIKTGETTEVPGLERPAFSPDGQWIVGVKISEGRGDINLISVQTRQAQPLVDDLSDERAAVFSKDGRYVFFTSDRRGDWDLWAVKVIGGKEDGEPILVKRDFGNHPIRLLDSGKIVFNTRDSNVDVYSVSLGSGPNDPISTPRRLSRSHRGKNSGVTWSPDGTRIAYVRLGAAVLLCLQDLQTGAEELINPEISVRPQTRQLFWSPDGDSVMYSAMIRGSLGNFVVYSFKDRTSKIHRGYPGGWSSDGKKVYALFRGKLMAMNKADGSLEEFSLKEFSLPAFAKRPEDFHISPDGQKLLGVNSEYGKSAELVILDRQSGMKRTVASHKSNGHFRGPRWSPDGSYFAYFDWTFPGQGKLVVESANGESKRDLTIPTAASSTFGKPPSWSPDGKQIALTINDGDFGEIGLLGVDLP